jgi:hypothetical protein
VFGIAASETWAKRVCEAVVETRDEGLCLAGEGSEIRRSSSSWGANLLHHQGAAGSIIHHSKSHKTPPTSNTRMAGLSEMHSEFQGLWTQNFQAWFTKKALMGDDDTIMFIAHNLVQVLFKYNHTQPFYVGYAGYASGNPLPEYHLMKWLLVELAMQSVIPLPRSWPKYRILVSKGAAILSLGAFLLFKGIYHAWFRV